MNQTDSRRFGIDNVNRTAVRHVNAENNVVLIGDDTIATVKFCIGGVGALRRPDTAARRPYLDDRDFISVNLLRSEQRPIAYADCVTNFAMRGFEPIQHLGFIVRNVDAWNSPRESVTTDFDRA
jgi:hypothetical protein